MVSRVAQKCCVAMQNQQWFEKPMCESAHGWSAAKRFRANWQRSCVHVPHTIINAGCENGDASSVVFAIQLLPKPFQKLNK